MNSLIGFYGHEPTGPAFYVSGKAMDSGAYIVHRLLSDRSWGKPELWDKERVERCTYYASREAWLRAGGLA